VSASGFPHTAFGKLGYSEVINFRASARYVPLNLSVIQKTYATANRLSVEQSAETILEAAEAIVAVDTGELRESGHVEIEVSGDKATGYVVFDAPHAAYVEYGTGIRGEASPGAGDGPYDPNWPGMPAQPYLRPALDSTRGEVAEIFRDNYTAATRLIGGK